MWRQSAMLTGKRWNDMADVLAKDMVNADKIAAAVIGERLPDTYALNANYGTYEIEHGLGIDTSWTMYDHSTVENLMRDNPQMIPMPRMDIPKDMRWNRRKITSAITQGVLQGDSIPEISSRLRSVTNMDRTAAIRNARTYTTAAENKGRIDSYQRAKELGLDLQKEWMSTPDGRTRDSHIDLDGERVDVDATFSNGCRYPADPMGDPAEVYNCRCTLVAAVKGRQYHDDRFTRLPEGMTYEDWKAHKLKGGGDSETATHTTVNGVDMSSTWTRREDKFDFAIEDVINAQGFDGLPRVVNKEEFDKAVSESKFIAQRTYSAPNQEVLDAYRQQLYEGKWYVDCSNGGAHYGQGMYCAANYTGVLSNDIKQAMHYYGADTRKYSNVETFTLTKDAKIIDYQKLHDMQMDSEALTKKVADVIFEKHSIEKDEEKMYFLSRSGVYVEDTSSIRKWLGSLSKQEKENINSLARTISKETSKQVDDLQHLDIGAFGALNGYDAINAENGMHTVILNRTKVIFKGE